MKKQTKQKRENRTITVDFNDEATYHQLCQDGKGFRQFRNLNHPKIEKLNY